MAKSEPRYISPFSSDYDSERSFFFYLLIEEGDRNIELPVDELNHLKKIEINLHESKASTGTLKIGTSFPIDSYFGRKIREHQFWKAGRKLTLFLGPRGDVNVFAPYYIKAPVKYDFTNEGPICTIKFRDTTSRMTRRKRQRRFKNLSAKKIVEKLGGEYDLNVIVPDSMSKVTFDDDLSFSQIAENDAQMLSRLCSYFGYKWRVDNGTLELYHPDVDMSKEPKTYYELGYKCGEYSIKSFKPRVKRVVVPLKPKNVTAGLKDPMPQGGFARFQKIKVEDKTIHVPGSVAGKVRELQKAQGSTALTPAMKAMIKRAKSDYDKRWKESQKWVTKLQKDPSLNDVNIRIKKFGITDDKVGKLMFEEYEKQVTGRATSDWIIAELVLAFPTTRLRPGMWVYARIAGSKFFSGLYKIKQAKISLDRHGRPAVKLQIKRRAWYSVYYPKRISSPLPLLHTIGTQTKSIPITSNWNVTTVTTPMLSRSVPKEWQAIYKRALKRANIRHANEKVPPKERSRLVKDISGEGAGEQLSTILPIEKK